MGLKPRLTTISFKVSIKYHTKRHINRNIIKPTQEHKMDAIASHVCPI